MWHRPAHPAARLHSCKHTSLIQEADRQSLRYRYNATPAYAAHDKDVRKQRLAADAAKRKAEEALVKLHARQTAPVAAPDRLGQVRCLLVTLQLVTLPHKSTLGLHVVCCHGGKDGCMKCKGVRILDAPQFERNCGPAHCRLHLIRADSESTKDQATCVEKCLLTGKRCGSQANERSWSR